jgi:hypothetical protein
VGHAAIKGRTNGRGGTLYVIHDTARGAKDEDPIGKGTKGMAKLKSLTRNSDLILISDLIRFRFLKLKVKTNGTD